VSLRKLAQDATPGPWAVGKTWRNIGGQKIQSIADRDGAEIGHSWFSESDARLIALAPDMAVLLADMADALREAEKILPRRFQVTFDAWQVLARFDALDQKAGEGA